MKVGQKAFFYHSNTKTPGIVAIVEVGLNFDLYYVTVFLLLEK